MSIYLTALIRSKNGHAQDLKPLLLTLVDASRKEAACIQYDLHHSVDDENQFLFQEEWKDQAGLDLHNQQEHLLDFVTASKPHIDGAVIIYKTDKIA